MHFLRMGSKNDHKWISISECSSNLLQYWKVGSGRMGGNGTTAEWPPNYHYSVAKGNMEQDDYYWAVNQWASCWFLVFWHLGVQKFWCLLPSVHPPLIKEQRVQIEYSQAFATHHLQVRSDHFIIYEEHNRREESTVTIEQHIKYNNASNKQG